MDHLTNWIEIPAVDFARAKAFYEQMLEVELTPLEKIGDVTIFTDSEGNRIGLKAAIAKDPISDDTMQRLLFGADKMLAFLVRRGPAYDDPSSQPLHWEHVRNMFTLLRTGKLRSVTALMDGTDVLGIGILAVKNQEEAEQILRDDPGVRGGRLTMQLLTCVSFGAEDVL